MAAVRGHHFSIFQAPGEAIIHGHEGTYHKLASKTGATIHQPGNLVAVALGPRPRQANDCARGQVVLLDSKHLTHEELEPHVWARCMPRNHNPHSREIPSFALLKTHLEPTSVRGWKHFCPCIIYAKPWSAIVLLSTRNIIYHSS